MAFLTPPRRFDAERTNTPGVPPRLLADNLHNLARLNRLSGGLAAVLRPLAGLMRRECFAGPLEILDIGAGSADLPRAMVCWAREQRIPLRVTAVDPNPILVELARKECVEFPQITIQRASLLNLPYEQGRFDYVVSSEALHHFVEPDVVRILRQAGRLARHGYVMTDLRRGRIAHAAVCLATRLLTRNPVTRFDAPASILNAFTPYELKALAEQAQLRGCQVCRQPWFRMALVGCVSHGAR